jgi:hypothetical protein
MGASQLSDLCRQLEALASDGNLETASELSENIGKEYDKVAAALTADGEGNILAESSIA